MGISQRHGGPGFGGPGDFGGPGSHDGPGHGPGDFGGPGGPGGPGSGFSSFQGGPPFPIRAGFMSNSSIMGESLLVGAFAVLAAFTAWILLSNRRAMPALQKALFGSSIMMFILSIAHLATSVQQASFRGFDGGLDIAAKSLALGQFVISDLILIWRVWTVWNKSLLAIILPIVTLAGAAVSTIYSMVSFGDGFEATITSVSLIVANSLLCAALVIIGTRRSNAPTSAAPKGILGILALVIGSGALLAVYAIISLIALLSPVASFSVAQNIQVPLIGILSSLILLLAYFTTASSQTRENPQPAQPSKEFVDDDYDLKMKEDHYGATKV